VPELDGPIPPAQTPFLLLAPSLHPPCTLLAPSWHLVVRLRKLFGNQWVFNMFAFAPTAVDLCGFKSISFDSHKCFASSTLPCILLARFLQPPCTLLAPCRRILEDRVLLIASNICFKTLSFSSLQHWIVALPWPSVAEWTKRLNEWYWLNPKPLQRRYFINKGRDYTISLSLL